MQYPILLAHKWSVAAWTIIILSGCTDGAGPSESRPHFAAGRTVSVARDESAELWESLAPGIAKALLDPALREALLVAWRGSEVTEHKLEFPTFGHTAVGSTVVHRAAAHLGWDSAATLDRVLRSVPVDFYVPGREHRQSWRATHDLLVATNFRDTPGLAFDVHGNTHDINPRSAAIPGRPIAMLQPAELKLTRGRVHQRSGGTIEDPAEPEVQVSSTTRSPEATAQPDIPNAQCTEDTCGGGGGGTPSAWTYLTFIQTVDICDNNFCGEGNEFELEAVSVATGMTSRLRITGVPSLTSQTRNDYLIGATPQIGGLINVHVRETDNWGDDIWLVARYQPNYVGPVDLLPQNLGLPFHLKENPYVGVFDPYRLVLTLEAH